MPARLATAIQLVSSVLVVAAVIVAALRAPADASLLVAIVAEPAPVAGPLGPLRDAPAPARRRGCSNGASGGPSLIPLVTSAVTLVVTLPAVIYPVMFWISLLGVLAVGLREGAARGDRDAPDALARLRSGADPPGSSRPAGDGRRNRDAGRRPAPRPASSTPPPWIGILLTIGAGLVYWLSQPLL